MIDARSALTVIIPTRNRSGLCTSLIHLLRRCGLDCTIVVADSSDAADAERNNEACRRVSAKQWSYAPDIPFYDKLVDALVRITTPLVVMLPDDDIALPHSLERCAAFLA